MYKEASLTYPLVYPIFCFAWHPDHNCFRADIDDLLYFQWEQYNFIDKVPREDINYRKKFIIRNPKTGNYRTFIHQRDIEFGDNSVLMCFTSEDGIFCEITTASKHLINL